MLFEKVFRIDHPCGIEISSDLTEVKVAEINGVIKRDMGGGYAWYKLPIAEILMKDVTFDLCFLNGVLHFISIAICDPNLYGSSWDEWSKEKELLRTKHTGDWLVKNGYMLGTYTWGKIRTGYDEKSGSGGGGVCFNL